jgi:glutathione synthase/RimK-type ligase-like ATP-grasp enzyme
VPAEARRFYDECGGAVIFKGTSNVVTLAQILKPEHLPRMEFLPHCPTLFQEYVAGVDYRVHVVGDDAFATRLVSDNEDYRRSALITGDNVVTEAATLPADAIARCIAFTRQLGLIVSGIDFKESPSGRLVALECNPYPQFTFYEHRSG